MSATWTKLLALNIAKLHKMESGIQAEIVVTNLRREADIATRSFRRTRPDLIAKKICDADAVLYAIPE